MSGPILTSGDLRRRDLFWRLACVSVAGIALSYGSYAFRASGANGQSKSGRVFPNLAKEVGQVTRIAVFSRASDFELLRTDTGWVLPQSDSFPIAEAPLSALIKALKDLRFIRELGSAAELNPQTNLLDPARGGEGILLRLEGADKRVLAELILAKRGSVALVKLASDEAIYEVNAVDWPNLERASTWLDLPSFDIAPERIATIALTRPTQARVEIVRRPDGGFAPIGGRASPMITDIALFLGRFMPENVMKSTGLVGNPSFSHETSLKSGLILALDGYEDNGRFWVKIRIDVGKATNPDEGERLAQKTEGWAFEMAPNLWTILTTPSALLLQASP